MEPTEQNRAAWDRLQRARIESTQEQPGLPDAIRGLLPDLSGKHVLHEQCGTGETSAELASLGAMVTGIDVAEEALITARRAHPGILFLQADPHALPVNLRRRRFDLVYAAGLLPYLQDLNAWIGEAVAALRVGGGLLVVDLHPAGACIDPTTLRWRDDYFGGEIVVGHRAQPLGRLRLWTLSELANAIVASGLVLRRLEEYPTLSTVRRHDPRVPSAFGLLAQKVADDLEQA
jgi:2-polyprenyl-3-methyl-5-hydroxy-6-metoxy-1,4-benzoquinol methylase